MKVVTRLRVTFAVYIALLGVLLIYHVGTIRRAVRTSHQLSELSARVRATSTEQVQRVAQLGENAAKYSVTRDRGYLDKFNQLADAYATELHHLQALPLSARERREVSLVDARWSALADPARRLGSFVATGSAAATQDSITTLQRALDSLQVQTQAVGEASQAEMEARLASSSEAAALAERISWVAGIGILLLTVVISALMSRSISEPLHRLGEGTRRVAEGQFDYRLESSGGDEFAQVAGAFNAMTQKLGALDNMKRDFVTGVSHDLKTPLSSMQETISVLLDEVPGKLTPKQRTLLLLNRESGEKLSGMLAKLLNLARLEAGLEPDLNVVDAVQLLRRSVAQLEGTINERDLHVDLVVPPRRLLLRCDQDRIEQVVDNLLENATKFSPDGGAVRVQLESLTDRPAPIPPERWSAVTAQGSERCVLWISVTDEGPGVTDAEKEQVFQRFYQTVAGRAVRGRGVGLGLTICRDIVAAHGGTIWFADAPRGGSVVNVLLPGAFCASPDGTMTNGRRAHAAPDTQ